MEIIRRSAAAFCRGDWEAFEASRDPHVVVRLDPRWPEQFIQGREAVLEWSRSVWEMLGPDVRVEELRDLGDRGLLRWHWRTRGAHSGIREDLRWSELVTMRRGLVTFDEFFLDHDEALAALGLDA
jgi:hypothetical protein